MPIAQKKILIILLLTFGSNWLHAQESKVLEIDFGVNIITLSKHHIYSSPSFSLWYTFSAPLTGVFFRVKKNDKMYRVRANYLSVGFEDVLGRIRDCDACYYHSSGNLEYYYISFGQQFYFNENSKRLKPYLGGDIGIFLQSYNGQSKEKDGLNLLNVYNIDTGPLINGFLGLELKLIKRFTMFFEINASYGPSIQRGEIRNLTTNETTKHEQSLFQLNHLFARNLLTFSYKLY